MKARVLGAYPALGYALYRRYWFASLASVGGWQISALGMSWLVYELSGSAFDLGVLGAATAVPAIVLTLFGGLVADRFDKRRVLVLTTAANAALLAVLALLVYLQLVAVWHVWLIAGAISAVTGVDWPVRQAFFPHLIERSAMLSAVALNSMLWQGTRMALPALAGLLLAYFDPGLVFVLAAAGYVYMLMAVAGMHVAIPGSANESAWSQVADGLRYILRQPLFRNLIGLSYLTMFFLSAYMQLMPAFADLLGAGPTGFGILMSVSGTGAIAGTVAAGALVVDRHYGRTMLGAAGLAGLLLLLFAWSTHAGHFGLALASIFLGAGFVSVFLIFSTTALQLEVPDALRGRVMGIHGITYSMMPLGALLAGALAETMSAGAAYAVCVAVYLVLLMAFSWFAPQVRALEKQALSA